MTSVRRKLSYAFALSSHHRFSSVSHHILAILISPPSVTTVTWLYYRGPASILNTSARSCRRRSSKSRPRRCELIYRGVRRQHSRPIDAGLAPLTLISDRRRIDDRRDGDRAHARCRRQAVARQATPPTTMSFSRAHFHWPTADGSYRRRFPCHARSTRQGDFDAASSTAFPLSSALAIAQTVSPKLRLALRRPGDRPPRAGHDAS